MNLEPLKNFHDIDLDDNPPNQRLSRLIASYLNAYSNTPERAARLLSDLHQEPIAVHRLDNKWIVRRFIWPEADEEQYTVIANNQEAHISHRANPDQLGQQTLTDVCISRHAVDGIVLKLNGANLAEPFASRTYIELDRQRTRQQRIDNTATPTPA